MRPLVVLTLACFALQAQTPAESAAMQSALQDIQQRATTSFNVLQSSIRPANWRSVLDADMIMISADAAAVLQTVTSTPVNSVRVPAGASLQAAIDAAQPGDVLVLDAGAVYRGNFNLPLKAGSSYITITGSKMTQLPLIGERVGPAQAPLMPRIVSPNTMPVFKAAASAHHYKIVGVEITVDPGIHNTALVQLGTGSETSDSLLPHTIELDRVYIHGDPAIGSKRGVVLNGKGLIVQNSHISDIQSSSQETQAVCAWNTPGPLQIVNNRLEASGMAVHIGGTEPAYVGVTPSDILINGNYMTRPLAWRSQPVVVDNMLEFEAGQRVTITGNILENIWNRYGVNLKAGSTTTTPSIITAVTFTENIVHSAAGAIAIDGAASGGGALSNIAIRNNLFDDIGPKWGIVFTLLGIYNGASGITMENNTATPTSLTPLFLFTAGAPSSSFVFRSNIMPSLNGMKGSGLTEGIPTLNTYFPGAVFASNVLYGRSIASGVYPSGNFLPTTPAQVGWVDATHGIWELALTSTYKAPGGSPDPGVDYDALMLATSSTVAGR